MKKDTKRMVALIVTMVVVALACWKCPAETFVFKSDFNLSEDGKSVIIVHEWREHVNQAEINARWKRYFELKDEGKATQEMYNEINEFERTSPKISRMKLYPAPRENYEKTWTERIMNVPKYNKKKNIDKVVFEYGSSEPTCHRERFGM